ncbi:BA14K family protein [Rhizobium sp. RAF56]|uniref:BA14K family protein n=1 Tax=Rhizobium sp. RAF56 TaxID=3233062 RepID=UPI003F95C244
MTISDVPSDVIKVQSGRRSSGRNTSNRSSSNYWRGYRGSRSQCRGCRRRNDGWWYPAAAFTTGVAVGSAISRPRTAQPVHRASPPSRNSRHVAWCRNRFRTFRVSDNTFQPNSGSRRQCVSPYR